MKGRHTFDVLAGKIYEIHAEYKIQHKVRATVTDNGSNFVKAYREFESTGEEAPDGLDDGTRFLDMNALLEMEGDEELHFFLPLIKDVQHTHPTLLPPIKWIKQHQKGHPGKCTEVQWVSLLLHGTRHTGHQQLQKQFKILPT